MSKKLTTRRADAAAAIHAGEVKIVDVFLIPSWLRDRQTFWDTDALREAKKRLRTFPEKAADRFGNRNEDRIYGYTTKPKIRNAIKDLIKQCEREVVSRMEITPRNVSLCRPKELLLIVHPRNGCWPGDGGDPTIRSSDIFDRVVLPRNAQGEHYFPLMNGRRLYLPLSRYKLAELKALSDATHKLAKVVDAHFSGRHPNAKETRRVAEEVHDNGLPEDSRLRRLLKRATEPRGGASLRVFTKRADRPRPHLPSHAVRGCGARAPH